ncbi:MAG: hypothetical protein ACRDK7_02030 [Solirubrobacteraceae bacterium]
MESVRSEDVEDMTRAMTADGVRMQTLQEWMGHRDMTTTQRYADYAPNEREVEMVDRAFGGPGA